MVGAKIPTILCLALLIDRGALLHWKAFPCTAGKCRQVSKGEESKGIGSFKKKVEGVGGSNRNGSLI